MGREVKISAITFLIFLIIITTLLLSITVSSDASNTTENEKIEFLKNYAIQNYGLDASSIQLQNISIDMPDFRCSDWYGHEICQASFVDKYSKTVGLYWDLNTSVIYDYKPTFYALYPEVSPRIVSELYFAMKNTSPVEKLPIVIVAGSEVIEAQKKELESLGMSVARPLEGGNNDLLGPNNWVQGSANSSTIEKIAEFTWINYIFYNPIYEDVVGDIQSNETRIVITSALIVSNSIDKPVANRLKTFLSGFNIYVNLTDASEFKNHSSGYDAIFILGGPEAYEDVGNISKEYLPDSAKKYLIEMPYSAGYWMKSVVITKYPQRSIIIAGHTRNETSNAEAYFELNGFDKRGLKIEDWQK